MAVTIIPTGLALPSEPAHAYPPTGTASQPASPTLTTPPDDGVLLGLAAGSMIAMLTTALMGGSLL